MGLSGRRTSWWLRGSASAALLLVLLSCGTVDSADQQPATSAPAVNTTRVISLLAREGEIKRLARAPAMDVARYREARANWERQRPRKYRWTYQIHCFCPPPNAAPIWTVTVDGERIVDSSADPQAGFDADSNKPQTVDQVFDDMAHYLGVSPDGSAKATTPPASGTTIEPLACKTIPTAEASFDPTFGFPVVYSTRDEPGRTADGASCSVTDTQWSQLPTEFVVLEP